MMPLGRAQGTRAKPNRDRLAQLHPTAFALLHSPCVHVTTLDQICSDRLLLIASGAEATRETTTWTCSSTCDGQQAVVLPVQAQDATTTSSC